MAAPSKGWLAWVEDEQQLLAFDGATWLSAVAAAVNPTSMIGVNATADATNRLAIASPASLFGHAGQGHQVKVNKASSGDTASILFQTGFSGRTELGTAGDDRFRIKVSSDGATWKTALVLDPATGFLGLGTETPEGPLHILRTTGTPIHERIDDLGGAPAMTTRRARGTPAAKTAVVDGDIVQSYLGQGYDGSAFISCANMRWVVEGTPSAGNVPTRIEFWNFTTGTGHSEKLRVVSSGNVGIGVAAPTVRLHVDGAVRVGQVAKAALPSASSSGAGAIVYVGDETGGAVLAFSDGTNWRRVTDRAVVS